MKKLLWVVLGLMAVQVPDAMATTFNWNYSGSVTSSTGFGNPVSGSGTLDAIDQGGGTFLVDAMSGTANGITVTGLTSYAGNDQLLFSPNTPQLDFPGLAFIVTTGQAFNLYYNGVTSGTVGNYDCGVAGYCMIGPGAPGTSGLGNPDDPYASVSFSATPVSTTPLPATWSMLLIGLIGCGFIAYGGTKKGAAAFAAA